MTVNSKIRVPDPVNEPIRNYGPGSPEKASIKKRLESMSTEKIEIPLVIGGKEIRTGNTRKVVMPHRHRHVLAEFHLAGEKELKMAAEESMKARRDWSEMDWRARSAVFLKAADLLIGPYRDELNGSTMLSQSKNIYQAEIDAACELIDFFKFNARFYQEILEDQPISSPGMWNMVDYRPLDGFVTAITPFNFTSIAANLCAAPALTGNTVVWKPSDTQMLSAYYTMKLFQEAGVPNGVINMVAAHGPLTSQVLLHERDLAGVHFTGSTQTFRSIYNTIGSNIANYTSYPRVVGETGGKDFVFAHASADVDALAVAMVRGAYEYQGQKCSAASRAYIPKSIWPQVKARLLGHLESITVGDVTDFSNFMNAVIDERSFNKIMGYINQAHEDPQAEILFGGKGDSSEGYFVEPTLIETSDPKYRTMVEEIFGPVLTVHVYDDAKWDDIIEHCHSDSAYALTGCIWSQDRQILEELIRRLRFAAGNFYLNDKPTAAVVGQQPFGGSRASGTNDKAGSAANLMRWISARTMKETFVPPKDYRYPFMAEK